jgi:hypothetical protein
MRPVKFEWKNGEPGLVFLDTINAGNFVLSIVNRVVAELSANAT